MFFPTYMMVNSCLESNLLVCQNLSLYIQDNTIFNISAYVNICSHLNIWKTGFIKNAKEYVHLNNYWPLKFSKWDKNANKRKLPSVWGILSIRCMLLFHICQINIISLSSCTLFQWYWHWLNAGSLFQEHINCSIFRNNLNTS